MTADKMWANMRAHLQRKFPEPELDGSPRSPENQRALERCINERLDYWENLSVEERTTICATTLV